MINDEEKRLLYECLLTKYGEKLQLTIAMEEMSELQKELCKYLRGYSNRKNIAEEIADVQIMLEQLIQIFQVRVLVEHEKHEKLNRIKRELI